MDYFQAKGTLERGQHFIHISYDFYLEAPPETLSVKFSYSPYWGEKDDPEHLKVVGESVRTQLLLNDPDKIQAMVARSMPLKNGITIALADPLGFRGEDHKMVPERTIYLSEDASTPCFSNRNNIAGQYKILLHVYNIATDQCDYQICVGDEKP